jgi:hypothetical protein
MGDPNIVAYDAAMDVLADRLAKVESLSLTKDELGLRKKEIEKTAIA